MFPQNQTFVNSVQQLQEGLPPPPPLLHRTSRCRGRGLSHLLGIKQHYFDAERVSIRLVPCQRGRGTLHPFLLPPLLVWTGGGGSRCPWGAFHHARLGGRDPRRGRIVLEEGELLAPVRLLDHHVRALTREYPGVSGNGDALSLVPHLEDDRVVRGGAHRANVRGDSRHGKGRGRKGRGS